MANPAEQPSDGQDGLPPTTSEVAQSDEGMTPLDRVQSPVPTPRTPEASGDASPDRRRLPLADNPAPAELHLGQPGPAAARPGRGAALLAGITAAVLVVGLAWWAHGRGTAVASQELPAAGGVATMRITVPGTDEESANAGTGGEAPTTKPTKRPTTAPVRASASPHPNPTPATALTNTANKNLALHRRAWASGSEGAPWVASNAVDGNAESRWSSAFTDTQWLAVDLGARWQINKVRLSWEDAYAKAFRVDVSNDSKTWKSVYSTNNGQGGDVSLEVAGVPARYVRVYCIQRSGTYGYSLFEVDVR